MGATYQCQARVQRADPEVLAIHCSDHRFVLGIREFLDEGLGLKANYDSLVVPGGPQCLVEMQALPKFSGASRKWARMLIDVHGLKRLVLIAHQDCGWYQRLAQWDPVPVPVRGKQEEDLRAASRAASQIKADLAIDLLYAGWDGNDVVVVETIRK